MKANLIQQQQIVYEMDMYKAQKMFEMQHYLSMSWMYSMARSPMPPTTHLSGPEMDEACMQVPERDVPAAGQGHAGRAGAEVAEDVCRTERQEGQRMLVVLGSFLTPIGREGL